MKTISEPLSKIHRRSEFRSGVASLDAYFHEQANQDVKRKLSTCFVCTDSGTGLVKGYYTLSNSSVDRGYFSEELRKKFPKSYDRIPATLIGRFALDLRYQGTGMGAAMLVDALRRCAAASLTIASYGVAVDPVNEKAYSFYAKHGFTPLPDSGKMLISMKLALQLLDS